MQVVHEAMEAICLDDLAIACEIIYQHRSRVHPALESFTCYEFLIKYFIRCMTDNPVATDYVHSRFEAARELRGLLSHWAGLSTPPRSAISILIASVTKLYVGGDRSLRNAIVTGFLEHVFEESELIALFADWKDDAVLGEAYDEAMQWANGRHGERI